MEEKRRREGGWEEDLHASDLPPSPRIHIELLYITHPIRPVYMDAARQLAVPPSAEYL
jgi:hypothetical protein